MSWALKVKMLERKGKTREEALVEVVEKLEQDNKTMDIRLAACMEYLTDTQIKEIFGDITS